VCFANKNKTCHLSYDLFQTSQTGGQRYSDTSPFRIPWLFLLDVAAAQILTIKVGTSIDPGCLHLFWFSYLCQLLEFALDEVDYLQTNMPSAICFFLDMYIDVYRIYRGL